MRLEAILAGIPDNPARQAISTMQAMASTRIFQNDPMPPSLSKDTLHPSYQSPYLGLLVLCLLAMRIYPQRSSKHVPRNTQGSQHKDQVATS